MGSEPPAISNRAVALSATPASRLGTMQVLPPPIVLPWHGPKKIRGPHEISNEAKFARSNPGFRTSLFRLFRDLARVTNQELQYIDLRNGKTKIRCDVCVLAVDVVIVIFLYVSVVFAMKGGCVSRTR